MHLDTADALHLMHPDSGERIKLEKLNEVNIALIVERAQAVMTTLRSIAASERRFSLLLTQSPSVTAHQLEALREGLVTRLSAAGRQTDARAHLEELRREVVDLSALAGHVQLQARADNLLWRRVMVYEENKYLLAYLDHANEGLEAARDSFAQLQACADARRSEKPCPNVDRP